jgi:type IV pilus assembly protein PilW
MRQRGFSLVEFMIAMTIGLFLVGGLVYLIAETSRSRAEIERNSRQIENGRYAIDRIAEDLRHAGFYSEFFSLPVSGEAGFPATTAAALPCGGSPITAANLQAGLPLGVQGYDGGAWSSLPAEIQACVLEADYQPNTDILVVRRASTTEVCPPGKTCPTRCPNGQICPPTARVDIPAATADENNYVQMQTTPTAYKFELGSSIGTFDLTQPFADNTVTRDVPWRRYLVRIYFVSKCNVPASGAICNGVTDDGGTPIPTLKMLELGAGPAFQKLALAEGIEQLQFDFGIDDPVFCGGAASAADGVADCFVQCTGTSCSTAVWSNVVSVQVNLVARNTERSPDYVDDKTYVLGLAYPVGTPYTPAAGVRAYRRHAYSNLVRVNNISMRRE